MLTVLTTGCAITLPTGPSETEAALCRELRAGLPTFEDGDSRRTKIEVAGFRDLFDKICDPTK
jgi:hypothetical protein